jgi:hypothetical protein
MDTTLDFLADGKNRMLLRFKHGPGMIKSALFATGRWFLRRFDDITPYLSNYSDTIQTVGFAGPVEFGMYNHHVNEYKHKYT